MPGWLGRLQADTEKKNLEINEKKFASGERSEDVYLKEKERATGGYLYGKAKEAEAKKKGILGGFADVGKIAAGTLTGLISSGGNPLGAAAGFASTAQSLSAASTANDMKAFEKLVSSPDKLVKTLGGLNKPTSANTGIAGNILNNNDDVSLLGNIVNTVGNAAVKFSSTGVGQAATGVLTNYLSNLATPKTGGSSTQDLLAALVGTVQGNPALAQSYQQTPAQQAVFGGTVTVGSGAKSNGWWEENRTWASPVFIIGGIIVFFGVVYNLFKPKRKR